MILAFRPLKRQVIAERLQDRLAQAVMEAWSTHTVETIDLAIYSGQMALERGETLMQAMDSAELVISTHAVRSPSRDAIIRMRNQDRLMDYCIKRSMTGDKQ